MVILSVLIGYIILSFLYKRYVPVSGISSVTDINSKGDTVLLDLRDYQTSSKENIPGAINIPYSYLNRYHQEIPKREIVVIATDAIEKNLAIRFLLKKNFSVKGFIISDERIGFQPLECQTTKCN